METTTRYTVNSARVVFFARYEASSAGCAFIEPQHLILALIRQEKSLFKDADGLRASIEQAYPPVPQTRRGWELPLSEMSRLIFTAAENEATRAGDFHIEPRHLLAGMMATAHWSSFLFLNGAACGHF